VTCDDANTPTNPLPSSVDGAVTKIGYTYDDFERITKVTSYDGDGDPNNEVAFEYGPWGVVTKSMQNHEDEATSADPNVQYAYEDGSVGADLDANYVRPDYVTYPGPSTRRVVYYNYPTSGVGAALSRLGEIADNHGDQGGRTRYASYTFLGAGTMVDANYPAGPAPLGTGIPALTYGSRVNSYSGLDRFGRVVNQKWQNQSAGTVKDQFAYAYDRTSNRLYRTNEVAANHAFDELYHANGPSGAYDGLDRLTGFRRGTLTDTDSDGVLDTVADNSTSRRQEWSLDPVGNWSGFKSSGATTQPWDLDQARLHNKANEIEDSGQTPNAISGTPDWVDPAYDLAGNMTKGPQPRYETVDANTQWYKYDAWNRLTRLGQGASSPGALVATYSYDGQNRRIRKVVEAGETDITYDYYYNESWQVLEVQKGGSANPYEQYVWGIQYVDAPVVRFQDSDTNGTLNNTLYYTYDAQFNVTALIEPDGDVVERYVYDPYGQVTIYDGTWSSTRASSSFDNCIMYCGYWFDKESGNYIARRRYLTPPLGRWLTTDPIGYGDGMNWYQYVGGAPTVAVDPDGLMAGCAEQTVPLGNPNPQPQAQPATQAAPPSPGSSEAVWRPSVSFQYDNADWYTAYNPQVRGVGVAAASIKWGCDDSGNVINLVASDDSSQDTGIRRHIFRFTWLAYGVWRTPTFGPTTSFQEKEADCGGKKGILLEIAYTVDDARPTVTIQAAPKGIGGRVSWPEPSDGITVHLWYKICCCAKPGKPKTTFVDKYTEVFTKSTPGTNFSINPWAGLQIDPYYTRENPLELN